MSVARRGTTRPLSVAPMVGYTDRHFRLVLRLISRHVLLYTPMLAPQAVLRHSDRLLALDPREHPVSLQLGGSDPRSLAEAARAAWQAGFDEINLNLGCPSPRASGCDYGVVLMREPERAAAILAAMRAAVPVPVTAKIRIGVDELDSPEHLHAVVGALDQAGADRVTIHARKAWLDGLDPKANRSVPPLRHDRVHAVKRAFPHLPIELNGGIRTLSEAAAQLDRVDAVMLARAVLDDPYLLAGADALFGDPTPPRSRVEVVEAYLPHAERAVGEGEPLGRVVRGLLRLFAGEPGGRAWRQQLSEGVTREGAGVALVHGALAALRRRMPALL